MENGLHEVTLAREAVFKKSTLPFNESLKVIGYEFDNGIFWDKIMESMKYTGFQATNLGLALDEIWKMIYARNPEISYLNLNQYDVGDHITETFAPFENCHCINYALKRQCVIFLSYTSNMVSCGIREILKYLVKHHMIDVIVTTAGGIEEDLIKCLAPTFLGDFNLDGTKLRPQGLNRIGNLIVPNENYCKFEDWILPIFDQMLFEQKEKDINWTPSKMISRFGHEINDPSSIYYWAHRNNIPVFCPALTDGSIGDMLYFHSYKNPGLRLDLIEDVKRINNIAIRGAPKTGVIILGGGLIKHHTLNANMMRNGADFSVYINSFQEFDGSDAGASTNEALSWGKLKAPEETLKNVDENSPSDCASKASKQDEYLTTVLDNKYNSAKHTGVPVKVFADASLIFPFIVASTFAKHHEQSKPKKLN